LKGKTGYEEWKRVGKTYFSKEAFKYFNNEIFHMIVSVQHSS